MKSKKLVVIYAVLAVIGCYPFFVNADERQPKDIENEKLTQDKKALAVFNDLMAVMEETTEIATKTRMNADWVPGIVTVLKGSDLEAQGFRTVKEALATTPGMAVAPFGENDLIVRGVGKFVSGKLKMLVNGISVTDIIVGLSNTAMLMPIESIERIEVIRGTGAVMYGENAYTGVVNIITRKEGTRLFGQLGSFTTRQGGGVMSYANTEKALNMSLNLAGFDTQGGKIQSGLDTLAALHQPGSYSPNTIHDKEASKSGIFTLDYQNTSLVAQYLQRTEFLPFGVKNILPPSQNSNRLTSTQYSLEAKQKFQISSAFQTSLHLGGLVTEISADNMYVAPFPAVIQPLFGPGVVANNFGRENRLYGGIDSSWRGWNNHLITINIDYASTKVRDSWQEVNVDPTTNAPLVAKNRYPSMIKNNIFRDNAGIVIEDKFEFSNQTSMTTGLRYDHYSDVGNSLNPRVALVFQPAEHHILKAQFSTAFRPPTFMEMYSVSGLALGNQNLKPETIRTYEASYIYRNSDIVGRATLFHSNLNRLISLINNLYQNTNGANMNGVELELEKSLTSHIKFNANLSYVKTKDLTTGIEIANSANWLSNIGLVYQPNHDYLLNLHYGYIGDRNREVNDPRNLLGSNNTFDLTGSIFNLWTKGLAMRVGIKNLLNSNIRLPAPANTYPGDYPRAGREWWMGMVYDF